MNEIEKELEKHLKINIEDFKGRIIEEAVCVDADGSKKVVVVIYPAGGFYVAKENADFFKTNNERFQYNFDLIEPWEVDGYESVIETEDGVFINMDSNEVYDFEDELFDDLKESILEGDCEKFNEEWEDFLNKYDKWRKEHGI